MQPAHAERGGDLGGQRRPGGRGGPPTGDGRAEQLAQQLVVHVGPPGQAGGAHLGRDQRAGRLGRDQQPEAARVRGHGGDPGALVGVDRDEVVEGRPPEPEPAPRTACPGRDRAAGGDGRRVGRHRRAAQPGPRGGAADRGSPHRPAEPSSSASVSSTSWQRSTRAAGGAAAPDRWRAVDGQTHRGRDAASWAATAAARSVAVTAGPVGRPPSSSGRSRPEPPSPGTAAISTRSFNLRGTTSYFVMLPVRPACTWRWKMM